MLHTQDAILMRDELQRIMDFPNDAPADVLAMKLKQMAGIVDTLIERVREVGYKHGNSNTD